MVKASLIWPRWAMAAFEQFGGFDHHAVLTEAAQRRLFIDPCLLYRMERVGGFGLERPFCWPIAPGDLRAS